MASVKKIRLIKNNSDNKRKVCLGCKKKINLFKVKRKREIFPGKKKVDLFKVISDKVNAIEAIINNFSPNKNIENKQLSKFTYKFILNNTPCELEYDLENFTFENLQKLAVITTNKLNNKKNLKLFSFVGGFSKGGVGERIYL